MNLKNLHPVLRHTHDNVSVPVVNYIVRYVIDDDYYYNLVCKLCEYLNVNLLGELKKEYPELHHYLYGSGLIYTPTHGEGPWYELVENAHTNLIDPKILRQNKKKSIDVTQFDPSFIGRIIYGGEWEGFYMTYNVGSNQNAVCFRGAMMCSLTTQGDFYVVYLRGDNDYSLHKQIEGTPTHTVINRLTNHGITVSKMFDFFGERITLRVFYEDLRDALISHNLKLANVVHKKIMEKFEIKEL